MAKRKYEFKPDPTGAGLMNKLHLTPAQRAKLWQWICYGGLFAVCLAAQDSLLARWRLFGGVLDLAPCVILLIYVFKGAEDGCVFALSAALFYEFSGSAPGIYVVILITVIGAVASGLQRAFLQPGFWSDWLATGLAVALYELSVFGMGMMLGLTYMDRIGVYLATAVLCVAVIPALYVPVKKIGEIGGQIWNE